MSQSKVDRLGNSIAPRARESGIQASRIRTHVNIKEMRSEPAGKEAEWWGLRVQMRGFRGPDKESVHWGVRTGRDMKERSLL